MSSNTKQLFLCFKNYILCTALKLLGGGERTKTNFDYFCGGLLSDMSINNQKYTFKSEHSFD